MGAGDRARHFRERLVTATAIDDIVVEDGDTVPDSSPFPDQNGTRIGSALGSALVTNLSRSIANAVKDPLRGRLETTERSFLQPVRNGPDHQYPAEVWRRLSTKKRRPFLSQSWDVKNEKVRNLLCQLFWIATNAEGLFPSIWQWSPHGNLRSGVHVRSVCATNPVVGRLLNCAKCLENLPPKAIVLEQSAVHSSIIQNMSRADFLTSPAPLQLTPREEAESTLWPSPSESASSACSSRSNHSAS